VKKLARSRGTKQARHATHLRDAAWRTLRAAARRTLRAAARRTCAQPRDAPARRRATHLRAAARRTCAQPRDAPCAQPRDDLSHREMNSAVARPRPR
jgi:hypothetical protein